MSYRSIIVNLGIDADPAPMIRIGIDLAQRFGARLIGLAAADVPPLVATGDGMIYEGEVMQIQHEEIEKQLGELRAAFEKLVPVSVRREWRQAVGGPTRFLTGSARAADLIVTAGGQAGNVYRAVDIGSLALAAGRPILVVAGDADHVRAQTVLVAWKDTREARRAIADALPLLGMAGEVVVATIDNDADVGVSKSLADVLVFLELHGVKARTELIVDNGDGGQLPAFARSIRADLVVSGAYGHSRLREWAFGGVTRSLLEDNAINRFLSY